MDALHILEKSFDDQLLRLRNPAPPQQELQSIYELEVSLCGVGSLFSMNARFGFDLPYTTQIAQDAVFFLQSLIWNQYNGVLSSGAVQLKADLIRAISRAIVEKENPKAYGQDAPK